MLTNLPCRGPHACPHKLQHVGRHPCRQPARELLVVGLVGVDIDGAFFGGRGLMGGGAAAGGLAGVA